jgi:hypothetical protein
MTKERINTKEAVADIRLGMDDASLKKNTISQPTHRSMRF